jgi:aspartate 1-decarboxylase
MDAGQAKVFKPELVYVDEDNVIVRRSQGKLAAV